MPRPGWFDVEHAKASIRLSDLIGRTVKLVKRGHAFFGLCPFHREKTPSFEVRDLEGSYHCFGCGVHGDAIAWLAYSEGLTFEEAMARLGGAPEPRAVRDSRLGQARHAARQSLLVTHWMCARPLEGSVAGAWLRYAFGTEGAYLPSVRWREDDWHAERDPPLVAKVESGLDHVATYDRVKRAVYGAIGDGAVRYGEARPLMLLTTQVIGAMWLRGRFGVPCWASLESERLSKVGLPDECTELVIFAESGEGEAHAWRAAEHHETQTRTVTIERIPDHVAPSCD